MIDIALLLVWGIVTWCVASEGPWGAAIVCISSVISGLLAMNFFEPTAEFLAGLSDHGLTPAAVEDGMYNRDTASALTRAIFSRRDRPDAVFVGNDHMAFAVMDTLRFELGLSVPDDVSVVGYDDVPIAAWPAYDLTTIRQPVNQMVDATVDTLLSRVNGSSDPIRVHVPGPLMIRGSARKPKVFNT